MSNKVPKLAGMKHQFLKCYGISRVTGVVRTSPYHCIKQNGTEMEWVINCFQKEVLHKHLPEKLQSE
jgi:hypothetical protein